MIPDNLSLDHVVWENLMKNLGGFSSLAISTTCASLSHIFTQNLNTRCPGGTAIEVLAPDGHDPDQVHLIPERNTQPFLPDCGLRCKQFFGVLQDQDAAEEISSS